MDSDINETMHEISKVQALTEVASSKGEELDGIEQKIVELEREKNRLQDIGFSLTIALKTLDEAGQEIKRGFAPLLNQKLGSRVLKITGSRYSEINADDGLYLGQWIRYPSLEQCHCLAAERLSRCISHQDLPWLRLLKTEERCCLLYWMKYLLITMIKGF